MEAKTGNETKATSANNYQDLETLLALFPAQELQQFYTEHSKQMLLTTSAQVERHEALQKLLQILTE